MGPADAVVDADDADGFVVFNISTAETRWLDGDFECWRSFRLKSPMVVRLMSAGSAGSKESGDFRRGCGCGSVVSVESFILDVNDTSSEQEDTDGVGVADGWMDGCSDPSELDENDSLPILLFGLLLLLLLLLNSRNPPSSGLSLPASGACSGRVFPGSH